MELVVIARIYTEFEDKFGIPRQSGLVPSLRGEIVFEPEFRTMDAVRGLEDFSHIWLLWEFSKAKRDGYALTVTPPRLGGKVRKGVFATRAPYRPNSIGLSSVKLEDIYLDEERGPVLVVSGADLLNGTPIYDIKPYVTYSDCIPESSGGFSEKVKDYRVEVVIPEVWMNRIPQEKQQLLTAILEQDPRPSYQEDTERIYGMEYGGMEVKFCVSQGVLTVVSVEKA